MNKMANGGSYILLDGVSGCGKSAQMESLKAYLPKKYPDVEFVFTREPGGTDKAEEIRRKLKSEKLCPFVEARLFAEARQSTLDEVVRPALARGAVVLSDRGITTSFAYQARGRELTEDWIWHMNGDVVRDTFPNLVVIFDVNLDACLKRSKGVDPDKFDSEGKAFWGRVMNGYEKMGKIVQRFCPPDHLPKFVYILDKAGTRSIQEINFELTRILDWEIREHLGLHPEGMPLRGKER